MTLLVTGSLHLDVVLAAPHLPAPDETVTGTGVDYVFGGKGGNQAVAAARMGAEVHFAGRAGSDMFGDTIRAALSDSGVNISQLQRDTGPSGMSAAIIDANGDYGAVIVSAANLNIDAKAISIPPGTALVLLQNEVPEEVNIDVARKAKAGGASVWLNAAPARPLSADLLALTDLVIVNRIEAESYGPSLAGIRVLQTLGPQGVLFDGKVMAAPCVDVVSSHGAGDMFVGALAARIVSGSAMEDALAFAQAAAALHVSSDLAQRAELTPAMVAQVLDG